MGFVEVWDFDPSAADHVPAKLRGRREIPQVIHLQGQTDEIRVAGADLGRKLKCEEAAFRERRLRRDDRSCRGRKDRCLHESRRLGIPWLNAWRRRGTAEGQGWENVNDRAAAQNNDPNSERNDQRPVADSHEG